MNQAPLRVRTLALGTLVLLFALLMLPNMVWLGYSHALTTWISGLALPAILLIGLFALLGRWPWFACLLLAPFALLAPLEAFYIAQYHHPTSAQIIATIVATNPLEAREYFGGALIPLAIALISGLAVALLGAWLTFRSRLRWRGRLHEWILAIIIATPLVAASASAIETSGGWVARTRASFFPISTLTGQVGPGYPFGVIPRVLDFHGEWRSMRSQVALLGNFRFGAHRKGPAIHQRQVYVLVIGESSRRADWQLFGYVRPTNPELSKVRNLVPIPHLITSWPVSIAAIPMILTRRKPVLAWNAPWHEASILRAMSEAGYETYWISNQQAIGKFDSPVSMYAYEAQHVEWLNHSSWTAPGSYDGDLIQPLRDALSSSHHDLFIVLHMMGSHETYDYRYPAAYRRWTPTQTGPAGGTTFERARNSYDNSILYTDHVLNQVIAVLKASGAVTALWYESDHGELLPSQTCDKQGHGYGTINEYRIPALFWYSDSYAAAFPQRVANLRAHAGDRTLSADTFESLIDMAGVTFPGHDESWSLFSPQWHYHTRTVHEFWTADFDHSDIGKMCGVVMPGSTAPVAKTSANPAGH